MVLIRPYLLLALACGVPSAFASPTSDEFMQCHRLASATLLNCLDQSPGHHDGKCWDSAREMNEACYDKVRKDHRPDAGRIEAEKQANEQRRKEREAQ